MTDARPLGLFDSGLGGVSVLREIRALLPGEDVIYCADSGYAPYGDKPLALIEARSLELCDFLLTHGAKALVIACNTATAAAAQAIRRQWPAVPVIGMEPAVKPATAATKTGVVGVLATSGTIESARFAALLDHFGQGVQVVTRPGQGLVEHVERGDFSSPALRDLLAGHLRCLTDAGADVIVLGCTHYVFLRPLAEQLLGPTIKLIDTGAAVARQVQRRLLEAGRLSDRSGGGRDAFWCSGDGARVTQALCALWPPGSTPQVLPASACMAGASALWPGVDIHEDC
ncbi:MAG: glutamate racemase [Uliginosibacterium sp.]|nr:glutamate racemase [Uliginosibacterium sp.]